MEARNLEELAEEQSEQMHTEKCVESLNHPSQLDILGFVLVELVVFWVESESH